MTTKKKTSVKEETPTMAAQFDQGQEPTICCVNLAKTPLGFELESLVVAMQEFIDLHFKPIWQVGCKLISSPSIIPGTWGMVFLDDSDEAGALGYHDLTADGLPMSKVFLNTLAKNDEEVSVTASHELVEYLIDPGIQMLAQGPKGFYAYEVADMVETETFPVGNFNMTNFCTPAWFEIFREPGSARFDYLNSCKRPFEIRPGGYMSIFAKGRWTQEFGSRAAKKTFLIEDHQRGMLRQPLKLKVSRPIMRLRPSNAK